jgi:hypothetical protein
MTKQEYQDAGFRLSLQVEQVDIDRAERKITEAYCKPLAPELDATSEVYRSAVMNLAFLWLLQHSLYGTRSGAKGVQITSATTPTNTDILRECAWDCHSALQELKSLANTPDEVRVTDICRIYFSTNYFSM